MAYSPAPPRSSRPAPLVLRYFAIYKPYGMLSQFSREAPEQRTLADLDFDFPKDVYPIGRLDADSEGLLLLTNDKSWNARLLDPRQEHPRVYWAQVEGEPDVAVLEQLRRGVLLQIDGKPFTTRPVAAEILPAVPDLPERQPPVRFRKTVPTAWLELALIEGKNRQVRRMCAAVGFPVLRLLRVRIGQLTLTDMAPGEVRELTVEQLRAGLEKSKG